MSSLPMLSRASAAEHDLLSVQLRKRYQCSEVERFELQIALEARPGVTILLGHSGAGKTTLLRCIAGLCNPEEGRITLGEKLFFDSQQGISVESSRRNVGFVFQDLALFPHLTILENVSYGLRRLPSAERTRRVTSIMESFQIAHLRKRFPREISGGEQQRTALARSLVTEPCVLLLDEPLSSLDVQTKSGIIDDLRVWNETRRIPMLYVTHNHEEVFALGEQVIALEQGRIIAQGAPLDVVPKGRRETMVQFAGFENLLEATVTEIEEQRGTVSCSLANVPLQLDAPLTRVTVGAPVTIGIRAGEILLASSLPDLAGDCNVISGRVKRTNTIGSKTEVVVDAGVEFRVHLPANPQGSQLRPEKPVWLIVQPHFCHLIGKRRLKVPRRLFLFVCNGNTSRSPIAQAICNAEIARRLRVPLPLSNSVEVQALSAGLTANPGETMDAVAQFALDQLRIPIFAHRSQKLNADLVNRAEAIFCMTDQQKRRVIQMFPGAVEKTCCLDCDSELEEPAENNVEAYTELARHIQRLVHLHMESLMSMAEISKAG